MAFSTGLPVSAIIKSQDNDEPKKKSREDWRKAKELEEARKLGNAPAAVDEEGKDINPHIPQYISQAPWYFGAHGQATLKHQRPQAEKQKKFSALDEWYKRGTDSNAAATKYRKGACENCGAMTHKKKDCFERPRRIGAKFNGADIKPDEAAQPNLSLDFDGKRDRWNGYDPEDHRAIIDEYNKIEEAKHQLKADKLSAEVGSSADTEEKKEQGEGESDEEDDEDKYADDIDMPGTKVDSKQRITVRNLRIREDTAKYLRNLDPNSAYYDPKTRSMRENPYQGSGKNSEEVQFAGENFVRFTGDTVGHAQSQLFAWDAHNKGVDVHSLADPTKLELLKGEFKEKKDEYEKTITSAILDRYGGVEHLDAPPKELIFAQSEDYVEYSKHGKIIKGEQKAICRSKYEEDVYPSNHTSVWGSYWTNGAWGYQCCHSTIQNSYCTGDAGKGAAANELDEDNPLNDKEDEDDGVDPEAEAQKTLLEEHQEKINLKKLKKKEKKKLRKLKKKEKKLKKKLKKDKESSDSDSGDSDKDELDPQKLKKALAEEDKNTKIADELLQLDERKRPFNSMISVKEPTKEEIEAFMLKRKRTDDPMAQFLS